MVFHKVQEDGYIKTIGKITTMSSSNRKPPRLPFSITPGHVRLGRNLDRNNQDTRPVINVLGGSSSGMVVTRDDFLEHPYHFPPLAMEVGRSWWSTEDVLPLYAETTVETYSKVIRDQCKFSVPLAVRVFTGYHPPVDGENDHRLFEGALEMKKSTIDVVGRSVLDKVLDRLAPHLVDTTCVFCGTRAEVTDHAGYSFLVKERFGQQSIVLRIPCFVHRCGSRECKALSARRLLEVNERINDCTNWELCPSFTSLHCAHNHCFAKLPDGPDGIYTDEKGKWYCSKWCLYSPTKTENVDGIELKNNLLYDFNGAGHCFNLELGTK